MITGNREHSADLSQGGLEVPCHLETTRSSIKLENCYKLLVHAPEISCLLLVHLRFKVNSEMPYFRVIAPSKFGILF